MAQSKKYQWLLYLIPIAVGGFFVWRLTKKPKSITDDESKSPAPSEKNPEPKEEKTDEQKKRISLANKLVKAFQKTKNADFSTTYDTTYSIFTIDDNGKEVFKGRVDSKKGTLMGLKGLSVKFKVDADGFIRAYYTKDGVKYANWFSPYPQEVKS